MLDMTPLPIAFSQMYQPTQKDINKYWVNEIYNMMVLNMLTVWFMPYYIIGNVTKK